MVGPGLPGDEVAVGDHFVDPRTPGGLTLGATGRVRRHLVAVEHVGGGENLRTVTQRCDRLVLLEEVLYCVQHLVVRPEIFGGTPAGNDECVVVPGSMSANVAFSAKS